MKFKKYLNEGRELLFDIDEFNTLIHKECKPYLKMMKTHSELLKRGMNSSNGVMGIKDVRKNRVPLGMRDDVAENLNIWLVNKGHNDRSKSFMTTSGDTGQFGFPYMIFPLGKFSYTWIDAKDINMDDGKTGWRNDTLSYYDFENDDFFENDDGDWYKKKLKKPFKDHFHTDKGINTAIKNKYEIWINCKKYYYIKIIGQFKWDKTKQMVVENE